MITSFIMRESRGINREHEPRPAARRIRPTRPTAGGHPARRRHDQLIPSAVVPALIADAGDAAGWRYVEFFTANIRNPNTRRAYARACGRFFAWCEIAA